MIKKLHQDSRAVSYLIVYIILSALVFGGTYSLLSDIRDKVTPIYSTLGLLGDEYNDADTQWGFDFLNFILSFSAVFFVIGVIWYAKQRAQRREIPYQ